MVSSPRYDNPHWEYHLPINPPIDPENDIDVDGLPYVYPWLVCEVGIINWDDTFQPRLRDAVQTVNRRMIEVDDYDPDLDEDSKDEYYDPQFD